MLNIPRCISCKYFDLDSLESQVLTCLAFPQGIPGLILANEILHDEPWEEQVADYVYEPDEP